MAVRQRLAEVEAEEASDEAEEPSEDEDDEAELLTDDLDRQIHQTLLAIKRKDPAIYNKDKAFFGTCPTMMCRLGYHDVSALHAGFVFLILSCLVWGCG